MCAWRRSHRHDGDDRRAGDKSYVCMATPQLIQRSLTPLSNSADSVGDSDTDSLHCSLRIEVERNVDVCVESVEGRRREYGSAEVRTGPKLTGRSPPKRRREVDWYRPPVGGSDGDRRVGDRRGLS